MTAVLKHSDRRLYATIIMKCTT